MTIRAVLLSLVSLLMLQGCGFHLRGKVDLPPSLDAVYIQSDDKKLATEIKNILEQSGASVVDNASTASAVIDIFQSDTTREVLTLDDRGKATSYNLKYVVKYRVNAASGDVLQADSSISMDRDFNFDPNQVLQKEKEENFLLDSMREELARRVLNRLSRISLLPLTLRPA